MDIKELKKLNEDAIAVYGRYEISKIQNAMGVNNAQEVEKNKKCAFDYIAKIDAENDTFNLTYKDVRDALFRDFKKKNVGVVGFVRRIGDDGHTAYYAAGLFDLEKSKILGYTDLRTAEEGYGVVIAVVPQPIDKPNHIIESDIYGDVINVFNDIPQYGVEPLAIKNYRNYKNHNDKFDNLLWTVIEKNYEKENKKVIESQEEKVEKSVEYQSTLHIMDKIYVRPYTTIGRDNEAREGKAPEIER